MKRTMTLLVVACLVASPALAYAQEAARSATDAENPVANERLIDAETLAESALAAAREIVLEEMTAKRVAPQGEGGKLGANSRIAIGLAMIVGGAAIMYKGIDEYQDEPDRFGRVKNADSWFGIGVGGTIAFFGAFVLKGGLEGKGFQ